MKSKIILISGGAATGKTLAAINLIRHIQSARKRSSVCKIDCLHSNDPDAYKALGVPFILGLSGDICPDHFLVSNLEEIISWNKQQKTEYLIIETAGLCNRCSPATAHTVSICVTDCTSSLCSPQKLGPMLTTADIILMTKIDMVSQAEKEIIHYNISSLNPTAHIFPVDGLSGYGSGLLFQYLESLPETGWDSNDTLRHSMPAGVCSYCVGEKRIGTMYQQGIVEKMNFQEVSHVS